ncbi:MAG TPA: hypothetical protein DEQ09_03595 [Bacteroidales bacterium]|nr:hypothetical protein [Bacteroidales bacterium]
MESKEDFDIFLVDQFREIDPGFEGDQFREKVLESLPGTRKNNCKRILILYVSVILSFTFSFLVIRIDTFKLIVDEFLNFVICHKYPSLETVLFTLTFLGILFIIPKIEYSDGALEV